MNLNLNFRHKNFIHSIFEMISKKIIIYTSLIFSIRKKLIKIPLNFIYYFPFYKILINYEKKNKQSKRFFVIYSKTDNFIECIDFSLRSEF